MMFSVCRVHMTFAKRSFLYNNLALFKDRHVVKVDMKKWCFVKDGKGPRSCLVEVLASDYDDVRQEDVLLCVFHYALIQFKIYITSLHNGTHGPIQVILTKSNISQFSALLESIL